MLDLYRAIEPYLAALGFTAPSAGVIFAACSARCDGSVGRDAKRPRNGNTKEAVERCFALIMGKAMSETFEKFQARFDIFANQQAAEVEAVRAILQEFLRASLATNPERTKMLLALRKNVDARLAEATNSVSHDQDATRKAQLVQFRAARIFDELAPALGIPSPDSSDPTH